MTKAEYKWAPGDDPPPIKQHSIAKHDIWRAYLVAYLQTLISSPRQDIFKLSIIDGFAGGGIYRHSSKGNEVLGSPFIALDAVQEASFLINERRSKEVLLDVDHFLIEADPGAYQVLLGELKQRGHASKLDDSIFVQNSHFEREAENVIRHILSRNPKAARAIFLLDQYGYSQVPTPLINSIFQRLPGAEIILTFAVDSFLNFASDKKSTFETLSRMGLPDIFRGRTLEEIKGSEKDWRLYIQSTLYHDLVHACGARYYTTFFIRSSQGHGDYWLIHLSQRPRARDVMTRIHWQQNNYFIHYGGAGLDMFRLLGYVPEKDSNYTGQSEFNFGFNFDEPAKAASVSSLMEQIPKLIYPDADGMSFGELFASTCNQSPACGDTYREAIGSLILHKELEVVSQDGSQRRSGLRVHDNDQVLAPRQRPLIFI